MLFNSVELLFFFSPVVVSGFFALSRLRKSTLALAWLVATSLFFYGWWHPFSLGLISLLIVFNLWLGINLGNLWKLKLASKIRPIPLGFAKDSPWGKRRINLFRMHRLVPLSLCVFLLACTVEEKPSVAVADAEAANKLTSSLPQEGLVVAGENHPGKKVDGPAIFAKQCALCHGETGDGKGIVPLDRPARSFIDGGFSFGNTSGALAKTIRDGIGGTPMPGFAGVLTEEEITSVVKVVQGFAPPAPQASVEEMVLQVADRPVVVRGHLPSVADGLPERPRGLLVGYANGFTFEYRADDLRLLAVRRGGFVERTDWGGRGGTPLKPLGDVVWRNSGGDPACPWKIQGREEPVRVQLTGTTVQGNHVTIRGELQDLSGGVFGKIEIVDEVSPEVGGFVRRFEFTSVKGDYGFLFAPADGTQSLSIPYQTGVPVSFQTIITLP